MIRATFRKLLRAVTGSAPQSPPVRRVPEDSPLKPKTALPRAHGNRYVPIPGHGPGAAARRLRAKARASR